MLWWQLAVRVVVSGLVVVGASELAKKHELTGALIASLPLLSIAAIIWLHTDTGDSEKVADFAQGIFWMVIPSLLLFLSLPWLLMRGWDFWPSLGIASLLTVVGYLAGLFLANRFA